MRFWMCFNFFAHSGESSGVCGKTRDLNRFTTAISTWDNWAQVRSYGKESGIRVRKHGGRDTIGGLMRAKNQGFSHLGYFQQKHEHGNSIRNSPRDTLLLFFRTLKLIFGLLCIYDTYRALVYSASSKIRGGENSLNTTNEEHASNQFSGFVRSRTSRNTTNILHVFWWKCIKTGVCNY